MQWHPSATGARLIFEVVKVLSLSLLRAAPSAPTQPHCGWSLGATKAHQADGNAMPRLARHIA